MELTMDSSQQNRESEVILEGNAFLLPCVLYYQKNAFSVN